MLDRKLARDLGSMKGQFIAIALVIACGVAAFVMALSTLTSLQTTRSGYYNSQRFGDVFARLKRAPDLLAERLAEIPGVLRVQTRVEMEVTLDMPDMAEPASGRIISIPERPGRELNAVYLRRGRWIDPDRTGEVIVSESFAKAHHLQPGDSFRAVVNGNRVGLQVVGLGMSPEYIYEVRPGELLPDNKRFGVMWMNDRQLSELCDLEASFNSLSLRLARGAPMAEVLRRVDLIIEPYGGSGSHDRDDQISHRMISDEMKQLQSMATVPTAIFLAVAAYLLNVVLARLISTQREQIAMIKAFGYNGREVGWHYAKMAGIVALGGALLGIGVGARIGRGMAVMYAKFFNFPQIEFQVEWWQVALALLVTLGASGLGVFKSVRHAASLPPAEAMRPETPPTARVTWLERFGLMRRMANSSKMSFRSLFARPLRTALGVLGISMAVAVLVLGTFSEDMIRYVMESQFQRAQRQDFTVTFAEPADLSAVDEVRSLPGVQRAELFRAAAVRMRSGHHHRKVSLMGYGEERRIYPVLDMQMQPVPLRRDGVHLSATLAEQLQVVPGDTVRVEVLEGKRRHADLIVRGLVDDFSGSAAYMRMEGLWDLLAEGPTLSGAHLSVDEKDLGRLYQRVKDTPLIAAITSKNAIVQSFRDTMAENLLRMKVFIVAFACIIAFGVVYNSARIAASERSRDFATLRVLGYSRQEVSRLFLGEIGTLLALALPLGLLIGYGFAAMTVAGLATESQRFPLVIYPATYAFALCVIGVASLLSSLWVRRKLDELDLIAVLKARD
ncbi:MAG: ABC transporter permease [Verrucomicrobiales bacterium]|nr:ABC transporter permease [Verrucomicrobiales bacterium]